MSKIVFMISVSLDGYVEGPERQLDWQLVDDELHRHMNRQIGRMGAMLDGRITYELMAGYWPTADADPQVSGPEAEFAGIWRTMPKYVFSRTLREAGWGTVIKRDVVPEEIRRLQAETDGDLVVGGANLAASFRELDLIDEHWLYLHPVVLGRGRRLFPTSHTRHRLRLADTTTFGNGVVLLRYRRPDGR